MLRGWISDRIKNGELFGWLLESDSYTHRTAVIEIGGQQFETLCNRVRTRPVKFPLHRNYGFRLSIPEDVQKNITPGAEIILRDKETGSVVHQTALKDSNGQSLPAYDSHGIYGKITGYLKDNCITGFLASTQETENKAAVIVTSAGSAENGNTAKVKTADRTESRNTAVTAVFAGNKNTKETVNSAENQNVTETADSAVNRNKAETNRGNNSDGFLQVTVKAKKRIAEIIIDGERYECVANLNGTYRDSNGRMFTDAGFRIRLSPDRIALLPDNFSVRLSDLETGKVIEERTVRKPADLTPANFDEYLRYSMISPVVYAPFSEVYKRCFAVMENICSYLEKRSDPNILLSVIMPVCNREGCVAEAIQSVLSQTHRNLELIIIDDGSTDRTPEIIRSFSDQRIRVLETGKNSGCAAARNLGLANAHGDYMFYLDSDNLWDRRYLSAMLGAFTECKNPDAVYCGQYLFGRNLSGCMAVRFASFNPSLLENRSYIDLNCFAHRRDTVKKIGSFNTSLRRLVDAEFILRISGKCRICSVPVLLSVYRYGRADNTITETEKTPDVEFAEALLTGSRTDTTVNRESPETEKLQETGKSQETGSADRQFAEQLCSTGNFQDNSADASGIHEKESSAERGITVIIPNFEGFEVFRQCVESILHNTLRPDEIIIADNCSSEKTVRNLIAFLEECSRDNAEIRTEILRNVVSDGNTDAQISSAENTDIKITLVGNTGTQVHVSDESAKTQISEDSGSFSSFQTEGTLIKLLLNSKNLGFTHAVNQCLALAQKTNDVIIANNDALFQQDAILAMKKTAYASRNCGLVAPRQMMFAGYNAITSHVPFANPDSNCDINLSAVYRNIRQVPLFSDGTDIEITYAPFFCIYMKRNVLNNLPALDEEHGRHFRSDRIFCDYVRNILGFRICYAANATVYHHHQISTAQLKNESPELYRTMYEQNAWTQAEREEFVFSEKIWQSEYDNSDREIWRIINSGYFDEKWYAEHYMRDSASESIRLSPLEHYLTVGWKKGFRPSEYFKDTPAEGNISEHRIMGSSFLNPLSSYLKAGSAEDRGKFSIPGVYDRKTVSRVVTLLERIGRAPNNSGDSNDSNHSDEMLTAAENMVFSPVSGDDLTILSESRLFNRKWYLKKYPDVRTGIFTPEQHYVFLGWTLGYDPSPLFRTSLYLDLNPDVEKSGICPLLHYLKTGCRENRKIFPAFSETVPGLADRLGRRFSGREPSISIIVASYNYAGLISEALDSILAQTYANFEVIIIDDGSSDNSVEVIKPYLDDTRFHLYTHENHVNRGLTDTVRLGLEKSSGDYVAFLEADDIWEKNCLEEKVACIRKYADVKIIVSDVYLFGDKSEDEIRRIRKHIAGVYARYGSARTYISPEEFRTQNWIFTFSCAMVRRDALMQCNFDRNPVKANLDWWLWRQICLDAPVYFINKKLTRWRLHNSYMESSRLSSRLNMEFFRSEGDRLLIQKNPAKAKKLKEFTNPSITFVDGDICRNGEVLKNQPEFSVIMPAYNSADFIRNAVDSLLNQQYGHFELIITDDGSTDGTSRVIQENYKSEISSGKIRLIRTDNHGVSHARNTALEHAKNPWIAYLDADNIATPVFLGSFAEQISENSDSDSPVSSDSSNHTDFRNSANSIFYGKIFCLNKKREIGGEFSYEKLQKENFIDLNAFCHSRQLYLKEGGFDTGMKRLVDWDLILRYVKKSVSHYIPRTLVLYSDSEDSRRISVSANLYDSFNYVRKKQNCYPTVTTVITSFNHENFISEAIESAIVQRGEFIHEILISDDGSADHTGDIISSYADSYPNLIRNISSPRDANLGISRNLRKCFTEAKGDYIAILEGDDYWTDQTKLDRQLHFLKQNRDCSMVFNRISLLKNGKLSEIPRQQNLPEKLTGENFIKEPTLNLIANFSCCFFRASVMKSLPEILFKDRFNEISLSFYIEQKGKIGFLSRLMTVYRIHDHGVWSAADEKYRLESGLACRRTAYEVCRKKYRKQLGAIIREKFEEPLKAMEKNTIQGKVNHQENSTEKETATVT